MKRNAPCSDSAFRTRPDFYYSFVAISPATNTIAFSWDHIPRERERESRADIFLLLSLYKRRATKYVNTTRNLKTNISRYEAHVRATFEMAKLKSPRRASIVLIDGEARWVMKLEVRVI